MAEDRVLKWQWPDERTADSALIATISSVDEPSSGFFGIKKSPSLVNSLPDPISIVAQIEDKSANTVQLTLPKFELANAKVGDRIIFGLIGEEICICIKPFTKNTILSDINLANLCKDD